jgi:sortase (surface protein transpeptidase)
MTPNRSRLLLVTSAVVLLVVLVAWLAWPESDGRADLEAVDPVASVTTTSTTATTTAPTDPSTTTSTTAPALPPIGAPVRLRIPAIGVDAPVVPVAIADDGQMEVPPATDVGWYRLGPAPGAAGSAVLAAHVDLAGQKGAFFDLRSVPVGAEVFVDGDGATRRFVVSFREQEAKATVQLDRYFTAEGPTRLTLITCGGVFDRGVRHYDDNIIITALADP